MKTSDPGVLEAGLGRVWGETRTSLSSAFEWRIDGVDLGPVSVTHGSFDGVGTMDLMPRPHCLLFVEDGFPQISSAGERLEALPGSAATGSPGRALRLSWPAAGRTLGVRIQPEFLASQIEALTGEPLRDPLLLALSLPVSAGAGAYVQRLCRFIASEAEAAESLAHSAVLTGVLESLARALLTGQRHNHAHLFDTPAPPSSRASLRRVEELLDAHAGEPIRTADLAAVAGAGLRNVEAAFERHRKSSAAAFLRSRRLHLARRMLLSDLHVPVPGVAYAAGFARAATFQAAYVRAFGERPEDTRRRGLLTVGPAPAPVEGGLSLSERLGQLSARERQVCACVAKGMLNKQIAAELGLSERTVKEYRAQGMAKLGVASSAALVSILRDSEP